MRKGKNHIRTKSCKSDPVDCSRPICSNNCVDDKGRILSVDYGEKNIGLACSDALRLIVRPLPSIPNSGRKNFIRKIERMVREMDIRQVIIGIPLNMDGSRNDAVIKMEKLMHSLETVLEAPLTGVDERLSTVEAMDYWKQMTFRQQKKYRTIDSLAAALILERYLKEH
jgi:putative Holliday junction resolvase